MSLRDDARTAAFALPRPLPFANTDPALVHQAEAIRLFRENAAAEGLRDWERAVWAAMGDDYDDNLVLGLAFKSFVERVVDAVLATVADHAEQMSEPSAVPDEAELAEDGDYDIWHTALRWVAVECREGTP